MNDKIENIINELNGVEIKTQKVYHSSFSDKRVFDRSNTFTDFDVRTFGAFHGACEIEGSDFGKQVAENRVGVKILEDANRMVGIHPELRLRVIKERSIDFALLKEETGYEVKGKFKNPIMIEADVSYTNALTLNENRTGQWTPYDIVREIMTKLEDGESIKGFTESDIDDYYDDNININGVAMVDLIHEEYQGEFANQDYKEFLFVRDWLESKGYDAIKYQNTFEGNSECIMSFRPENIKVTDSYCLKETLGFDDSPKEKKNNNRKVKIR